MVSSVSGGAATAAPAASAAPSPAPTAGAPPTGASDADTAKAMAFQYALSAALNAPDVLGGAGGSTADDDDDDGSNLTVKMGM